MVHLPPRMLRLHHVRCQFIKDMLQSRMETYCFDGQDADASKYHDNPSSEETDDIRDVQLLMCMQHEDGP